MGVCGVCYGMVADPDKSNAVKHRIRRFDRRNGEALIVSAMVAFFISAAILQFPEALTEFTAMLVLALWAYTALVFGFELVVMRVVR